MFSMEINQGYLPMFWAYVGFKQRQGTCKRFLWFNDSDCVNKQTEFEKLLV